MPRLLVCLGCRRLLFHIK
ncbi:hypothetical protein GJV85_10515 [Sulfurimonas aquatica]|uniref:Uncharacterized protein n=1 Tax=Sulfurimonas aquatica TaxID=2672570 RepID=A0A975B2V3_9BACT|nr:hypothetical protein GJV85_10515 [Sulfurimonas aquatica]